MPPLRTPGGRASKACDGCRRGKTRCYPSSAGSCLRCNTLRLQCSLQAEQIDELLPERSFSSSFTSKHDCIAVEDRVATLERAVLRLTEVVGLDSEQASVSLLEDGPRLESEIGTSPEEAPLLVIRAAATETGTLRVGRSTAANIVHKGILSFEEAKFLLQIFRQNYRRWIALRENEQLSPELEIESSPFLLCACCLIAVRHWNSERAVQTVDLLFNEAKSLLSQQLLQASQTLDFFQAILILSLWATTVGQKPLSLDGWLLTGYAFQHAAASDVFKETRYASSLESEYGSTIGKLLLWNRICMAHLHACISMRRSAMISKSQIERIRKRLPPGELSNYEMRMVAEVNLYWTMYENAIEKKVHLPQAQAALQGWKQVWTFLFDQPRPQFLQMGFSFAQLLIFEQALNNKSAAVRESLLSEMVRLCSNILRTAMETTDGRTKHLTDHIYHMITFAAVTLCRLLCRYDAQLQAKLNISESDLLILSTAQWLHTLGSPLHVGHLMGNVIDAIHRKLRPEMHLALRRVNHSDEPTPEQNTLPDLLGMGMRMDGLDFDWDAMVPDWQSFTSDEAIQNVIPYRSDSATRPGPQRQETK